ncbi:TcaA 3rd/4th domain-containing protein [Clostridium hydrogenum]|uniref:TcaA 3rd/4th domain-containing protein n=1 Tax=Clostridium hydrogenum TaxID=2855764 RepID=UPI001F2FC739|nr:hypothetical protein [Clostridium hydrogenum]
MILDLLIKPLNASKKLFDNISQNLLIGLSVLVPFLIVVIPAFIVKQTIQAVAKPFQSISLGLGENISNGVNSVSSDISSYIFKYLISRNLIFVIIVTVLIFGILVIGFNIKKIAVDYKFIWKSMVIAGIQIVYYLVIGAVLSFASYYFIIIWFIGIINSIICLYSLLFDYLEIGEAVVSQEAYGEIAAQSVVLGKEENTSDVSEPKAAVLQVSQGSSISERVQKISLKQKKIYGTIATVILIGIILLSIGANMTSKGHVSEKLIQAIKENNYAEMSKYIVASNPNLKVDKNNIKVYADFLNANPSYKSQVISSINEEGNGNSSSFDNIKLITSGRKFLFFTNNVYQLQTYFIKVKTPYKNTKVALNKQNIYTSSEDNEEKECGPYLPGKYKMNFEIQTSYADVDSKQDVILDPQNTSITEVNVEPEIDNEKVSYPYDCDDAEIFVNGKDTKTTVKDSDNIIPLPWNGKYSIQLEDKFPWGKMKSSKLMLKAGSDDGLNFDKNNDELIKLIKPVLSNFLKSYESGNKALDSSKFENVTDRYKGDLSNDIDQYKSSNQSFSGTIKSIIVDPSSLELNKIEDNYTLNVNVTFNADLSIGATKCFDENSYGIVLTYDTSQNKWLVDGMESNYFTSKIQDGTEIDIN